ncbi:GntR family transcriptional regulator [Actimicrobium sp. CCC2.4]|uniref:GntR family transcriptional regulator n=1 Tax=Actimicrobium sp. CCC2.4 TaxID=3048606 RepID=UPI002AC987C4|nr:GntR family transcriptional regulator [Actimicrobium sp. CCC2.4]MEB0136501.1 GntR family transcriptional regulator [Actimicrobium sp. CCC2.4]WPX30862.1 GntR family transcriptional regulator [Actimicrobium sp. CCC2.4]
MIKNPANVGPPPKNSSLPDYVYGNLRDDIFALRLLPGDQVTESDIAAYFDVSRTPVREALQRLQRDGLMQGYVRGGWEVVPVDFKRYEDLYEMRRVIELFAVTRLCQDGAGIDQSLIDGLHTAWCCPVEQRLVDGLQVAALDEAFHQTLVRATGNLEMATTFDRLTDRVRIVRRLDFLYGDCVQLTYDEHAAILAGIAARDGASALRLMTAHIEDSHVSVRQLTLHHLHTVRVGASAERLAYLPVKMQRLS